MAASRIEPPIESFAETERRIATIRARLPAVPLAQIGLIRLINHIYKHQQARANLLLRPYGLNYSAYNLLLMIYSAPGNALTASHLAEAAGEKQANVTRLCDELSARGLIERRSSPEDRRRVVLSLTEDGISLLEKVLPAADAVMASSYQGFSPPELKSLETLLRRQLRNIADVG